MKKVLIITGSRNSERKISLISAKQVKLGLEENGFNVTLFDLKKGYRQLKKISKDFDLFFPALHGEEGEGGELQKFLSKLDKPFVGGSWKGFKKGWYKIPFKKFCRKENVSTSEWRIVKNSKDILKFGFPSVLKTSNGGSSREVVILESEKDLGKVFVQSLLKSKYKLFIERFLGGVEVTVGILNDKPLPILEIIPPQGKWFDYKNKYSGATQEIPNAPSILPKTRKIVQQIALKIHKDLNLGQYSRIDFIVAEGIPYVLEVNTIPGLTSESLFPKAAQEAGIKFPKLVRTLTETAKKKYD
ncbi:ATP-grasp domain-containing protein [Candidatus Daviesbacteria bacterium]|nr:ATP-grasp domain-containing protein [Candidatus Daviesbacteria bacterium]